MSRVFQRPSAPASSQKVFLATPTYDKLGAGYTDALFHSSAALTKAGIAFELCILSGDCHVDDARNFLVRNFLESECTDLVFLDADIAWSPADLVALCKADADVVAGLYPLKSRNETFPVRLFAGDQWTNREGLMEVESVPTGFLRIRRSVLERLADQAPKFMRPDDPRGPVPLIFERTLEDMNRWGGDYTFCRKWRAMGGRIYVSPEMGLDHYGDMMFSGSLAACLRRQQGLTYQHAFGLIRKGSEPFSVYDELIKAWDNKWSVPADILQIIAKMGRDAKSAVEFGSGLTTAVLSCVCADVTAYEHDMGWMEKTAGLMEQAGEAEIILSPLNGGGFYSNVSGRYDLAVCDGPPRAVSNGRAGLYSVLADVLNPGGRFVIDDINSQDAKSRFLEWAETHSPVHKIITGARTFAVGRVH